MLTPSLANDSPAARDGAGSAALPFRRSARLLGVTAGFLGLALTLLVALGLNDVARRHAPEGLTLLLGALAGRWLLALALDEWGDGVAVRLRRRWRRTLGAHLTRPGRVGERSHADLAFAVERAAEMPALERLATSALSALGGLIIIELAGGWLPLVITIALLALAVPLYQRAGRRSTERELAYRERRAQLEARQLEILVGAPELRGLGALDYGASEIGALSRREHDGALAAVRVALESSLVTEFLSGVSVGLVAMVAGFSLLNGHLTLLRALVAVFVTAELFTHVRRYGAEFHRRDDATRALATLRVPLVVARDTSTSLVRANGLVTEASDVALDFVLEAGGRLAVSGPSGAGKTTLLHTLLGWRAPRHGTATLADVAIGFVGADTALLAASLRENLTLGTSVDDDALRALLEELGLSGARFEDLDVALLADGRGLSAGERARVVLARALVLGAPLLVIDDVAGLFDEEARQHVASSLARRVDLTIIEAAIDRPLLRGAASTVRIDR